MSKVFIFEDEDIWIDTATKAANEAGHEVIGIAQTPEEAIWLTGLAAQAGIAIIDKRLTEDREANHGAEIVSMITENNPKIIPIGNSGSGPVEGALYQAEKDYRKLVDILRSI